MKGLNEINTSEISERITAAANRLLGHHVGLLATLEDSRLGVACVECGGRWEVVDAERLHSHHGLDLKLTTYGDGYCEEGATNYFDSNGNVTRRI